jgi:hypothetical protein
MGIPSTCSITSWDTPHSNSSAKVVLPFTRRSLLSEVVSADLQDFDDREDRQSLKFFQDLEVLECNAGGSLFQGRRTRCRLFSGLMKGYLNVYCDYLNSVQ